MPEIVLETEIDAPIRRVFDLARDVDCHTETMGHGERAVGGTTSGLLAEGDVVTWKARHFGVPLTLTVELTEVDAPTYFRDEQVDGPFAAMAHDHRFESLASGDRTLMRDEFRFASPFGPLGAVVDRLVMERYLRRLLRSRNRALASIAEDRGASTAEDRED